MSLWTEHVIKWRNCKRCSLCEHRRKVVLVRGVLPCDILLIGEAPGVSEDVIGKPFVGPAGKLLDNMISEAGWNVADHDVAPVRWAATNLVGCIPLDEAGSTKTAQPPREAILACAPRIREIVKIACPSVILLVGGLAEDWVPKILAKEEKGGKSAAVARGKRVDQKTGKRLVGGKKTTVAKRSRPDSSIHSYRFENIIHPAAILRADISQKGLAIQRTIIKLRDIAEELALKL